MVIDSSQHSWCRLLFHLQKRTERDTRKMFVVEGLRFVDDACKAHRKKKGFQIQFVVFLPDWAKTEAGIKCLERISELDIPFSAMSEKVFRHCSDTENPQGVMAVVQHDPLPWSEWSPEPKKLYLVADAIQDPGNFGTLIRTAEAAGWDAILAIKGTVDLYNPKVVRSTAGGIFHIPVFKDLAHHEVVQKIEKTDLPIFVMSPHSGKIWLTVNWDRGGALVVGNEGAGIAPFWKKTHAVPIRIPIIGKAESLNAAVSAGIVCFAASQQQRSHVSSSNQ